MSDGENNESPQKEEVPMEQSGEEAQSEENKADVSTESKEDLTDTADNEVEPAESEDTTASDSPSKKSTTKKVPKKKPEYEYIEDDGERLGLLERPVIIESGKREKRKVERLEMTGTITPNTQKSKLEVPEGSGEKLGDCPRIEHKLQRSRGEDMKVLHRILFGRVAPVGMVKKNIRLFCGFAFTKEDKEYDKKQVVLSKINMPVLKTICEVLDVDRSGVKNKDDVVKRLMEFLLHPKSSGKDLPRPKKRKRSGKGNNQKGAKDKESSGKKAKAAKKDKSVEGSGSDDSPDEDEESEPDEKGDAPEKEEEPEKDVSEEEEDSEEEEEEAPKKKKQKIEKTPKKQKAAKETKKEKPEKKTKEKAEKKVKEKPEKKVKEKPEKKVKKTPSPKKQKKAVEIDDDSSEDDEPLAKKQPNEPPSDEDVKECIKKILEGANLEEVTMKTVLKQVYETYPLFDLSDRKTFIKTTVKQLIS